MKVNFLYAVLLCLFSFSCSDEIIHNVDEKQVILISTIIASIDSANEVVTISSLEEFYLFISKKININSLGRNSEYPILMSNATISTVTENGYTDFVQYAECKNLRVYFSDFQTADKLGITAHKTYYMTIGLASHIFQLQSNWRPSVAQSLDCGLLLDDPRNSDFVNALRGYVGQYNPQKLHFLMNTSLIYFLEDTNKEDLKIWFPCNPEKLKWNINILKL